MDKYHYLPVILGFDASSYAKLILFMRCRYGSFRR